MLFTFLRRLCADEIWWQRGVLMTTSAFSTQASADFNLLPRCECAHRTRAQCEHAAIYI